MADNDDVRALDLKIRRAVLILAWMLIVAGALLFLRHARPAIRFVLDVLSPFIVSLILAYVFNPIVRLIQVRFRLRRMAGVAAAYSAILLLTAAFFMLLLPLLYVQLRSGVTHLAAAVPNILQKILEWINVRLPGEDMARLEALLRGENVDWQQIAERGGPLLRGVIEQGASLAGAATSLVGTTLAYMLGFLGFSAFVAVISFYFLLDFGRIEGVVRVLLPDDREPRFFTVWKKIDHALGGFLRGQLLAGCCVGVMYAIGLGAIGMREYAILVGFLAGAGNLIPYLGPVLGGVPAGLWVVFSGAFPTMNSKLIGLFLIVGLSCLVQAVDGLFLQPRIVGKQAELHPLLIILALAVGAQFGLGGLVLAVPAAIIAKTVIKDIWWDPLVESERENKRRAARRDAEPPAPAEQQQT